VASPVALAPLVVVAAGHAAGAEPMRPFASPATRRVTVSPGSILLRRNACNGMLDRPREIINRVQRHDRDDSSMLK
jgi:hypothetical protein